MTQSKIFNRIRKLLALASSSNVHEAATAAAHAQKLIAKHRIDQAQVTAHDNTHEGVALDDNPLDEGSQIAQWQLELALVVAEANGCRVVVSKDEYYFDMQLVGASEDIEVVRALYVWLLKEINRLARTSNLSGKARLDMFRLGAIATIEQRLAYVNKEAMAIGLKDARKVGAGRQAKTKQTTALVYAGLQTLAQRGASAERIANNITEGREESFEELPEYDVVSWVNGAALGNCVDLHGHKPKIHDQ